MLTQQFLFIFRQGSALLFYKIVVNYHSAAFDAETPLLPGFMVHRKGFAPDADNPGMDFHLVLKKKFVYKIIVRVSHDEGKGFLFDLEVRGKDSKKRTPGSFKPTAQRDVVDVSETVCIAESGLYGGAEHGSLRWCYRSVTF